MPTNRTPPEWPRRRPSFDAATLELFRELEALPRRARRTPEFIAKSKRLGILLGLSNEWWAMLRVENANDPRPRPPLAAHDLWPRVQAIRTALLEALRAREAQPAEEVAEHPVSEAP